MSDDEVGVVPAAHDFPTPPVAVPSAISGLFHSLIGSVPAGWWRASRPKGGARESGRVGAPRPQVPTI